MSGLSLNPIIVFELECTGDLCVLVVEVHPLSEVVVVDYTSGV